MVRLIVWLMLVAIPAAAQFSSAIQGTITDASQAAVPEASVTLKNNATGITRETTTSAEGFFRFSSLGAGTYALSVQKAGFSPSTRDNIAVGITEIARVDFALSVGQVAEQVDVNAQVTLVETEQGRVSGRIDQVQLKELPINGRNVYNLIALQPGMTGRGLSPGLFAGGGSDSFSGETQPQAYASGQRWENNNYTVDDTSVNGVARNGAANLTPNTESVEEVRVVANNFSAVDGRNSGGQVQVITKGGTNQFHGSLSWYFTNNTLASRNFNETTLPAVRKNLYGYSVGGPIKRNRTFFFTSFEGLRQSGTRATTYTVETPEFRDFVLRTRPNSIAAKLFREFAPAAYPTTNFRDLGSPAPGARTNGPADGIFDVGDVNYTPASFRKAYQMTVRVDHELRPGKDRIYGSWFETPNESVGGGIRTAFDDSGAGGHVKETTHFGNVNYTHTFDSNKLNEFRAGVMQLIGRPIPRARIDIPGVNITAVTGFGGAQFPSGWWQTNYHYKDIFSWVRSTHTIKIGAELRHMRGSAQNTANFIPTYSFNSILDFADDDAQSMSRLVNPVTGEPAGVFSQLRQTEWALFYQDDWKIKRNLTLNIGLRYENYGTFKDKDDTLRNLTFGTGNSYEERLANGIVGIVDKFHPTDKVNLGPRFGFAWDPRGSGKMTIRGGYGTAFDRLQNLSPENYRSSPPLRAQAVLGPFQQPATPFTYSLGDATKPFAGYPVDAALRLGLDSRGGILGARTNITAVDPNLQTPYVHNWFLGIQRQVANNLVVELNYLGSAGHKLLNVVNVNRFTGDLNGNAGRFRGYNPSFGSVNMNQSTSNSIYNGMNLIARRAFSRGFLLQGNYTWGKAISDTDQSAGTTNWQNAYDRRSERGLAGFDTPHRVVIVGVLDLPFFKNPNTMAPARFLFGGWQLSGFSIMVSGEPLTITHGGAFSTTAGAGGDFNGDGTGGDRPNAPSSSLQTSGWERSQFMKGIFTVADFPRPVSGTNGNLGRNTVRGPGFAQTDLQLAKTFKFTERINAKLQLDAFNAFNRVNLNNPSTDLNSNNFGRSTSARVARLFQAGLRIGF